MTENQKQIVPLDQARQIDEIIKEALPIATSYAETFCQSIEIAGAVAKLKEIMIGSPEIKKTILAMADTRLGFLTDRPAAVIAKNRKEGKGPTVPYAYEDLIPPIIEGLLRGYRITGNEINIISGQFYGAKNGTFRKIREYPGITNFRYNNEPVKVAGGAATVKCWATWKQNGRQEFLGLDKDDPCFIQVRVNYGMGDDAVIGKVHAKLFKRVFERISGHVDQESTDIITESIPEAEINTGAGQPETAATGTTDDKTDDDIGRGWNPMIDPVRETYGARRREMIKRTAADLKIPFENRMPDEVHRDILDFMAATQQVSNGGVDPSDVKKSALDAMDEFFLDQKESENVETETEPGGADEESAAVDDDRGF